MKCDTEAPPLRNPGAGHGVLCRLPDEDLAAMEPVIEMAAG